ncbi:hypothetical protein [uncultured Ruegeria sp.]|uniref:hypothetical protein n=1 Tax=uncultured Ruegeria sp. TaxID=259304 RepID=UPI00260702A7|nr:hypothetical protein [uncultured Ruegeria sp.]
MSTAERDSFWRLSNPILWGLIATCAIAVFGAFTALLSVCEVSFFGAEVCSGTKWTYFLKATPNEVGDTLAGFAGALAFIWLIATVWLQSQELAEQRKELREQRLATQDMAIAQGKQVKLLELQGKIFEEEQKQRIEDRAATEFNNLLTQLDEELALGRLNSFAWKYSIEDADEVTHFDEIDPFYHSNMRNLSPRAKFEVIAKKLLKAEKALLSSYPPALVDKAPLKSGPVQDLFQIVKKASELEPSLSGTDKTKLYVWRIADISASLRNLMDADVWEAEKT